MHALKQDMFNHFIMVLVCTVYVCIEKKQVQSLRNGLGIQCMFAQKKFSHFIMVLVYTACVCIENKTSSVTS